MEVSGQLHARVAKLLRKLLLLTMVYDAGRPWSHSGYYVKEKNLVPPAGK
jgi:hypothetical protein